jgi:hypothetical protein
MKLDHLLWARACPLPTNRLSRPPAMHLRRERELCPDPQVFHLSASPPAFSNVRIEPAHNAITFHAYPTPQSAHSSGGVSKGALAGAIVGSPPFRARHRRRSSGGTRRRLLAKARTTSRPLPLPQSKMRPPVRKMSSTARIQTRSQIPPSFASKSEQLPQPAPGPLSLTVLMTPTSLWVRQSVLPLLPRPHPWFTTPSTILNPSRRRAPTDQTSFRSL